MKKISIIAAVDENWVIGKRNSLPWYLPSDLKHFKNLTTGHVIVMGRKTHDSIGKPLPDRINIVISRNSPDIPGCVTVRSVTETLEAIPENQEIFIIGGAEIYKQFLPLAQKIYLTRIHHQFDGDIFFTKPDLSEWKETAREDHAADEKNLYSYSFLILEKTRH